MGNINLSLLLTITRFFVTIDKNIFVILTAIPTHLPVAPNTRQWLCRLISCLATNNWHFSKFGAKCIASNLAPQQTNNATNTLLCFVRQACVGAKSPWDQGHHRKSVCIVVLQFSQIKGGMETKGRRRESVRVHRFIAILLSWAPTRFSRLSSLPGPRERDPEEVFKPHFRFVYLICWKQLKKKAWRASFPGNLTGDPLSFGNRGNSKPDFCPGKRR